MAPLSPGDDRLFVTTLRCVIELLESEQFIDLMRSQQSSSRNAIESPMVLLSKLNTFITSIYIPFIENIPPSVSLNTYREQQKGGDDGQHQKEQKQKSSRLLSADLSPSKVSMMAEIFKLLEVFIVFINRHHIIDSHPQFGTTAERILQLIANGMTIFSSEKCRNYLNTLVFLLEMSALYFQCFSRFLPRHVTCQHVQ